ncbi:hypothetical protein EVAR_103776_1 [Eumeta japonica]|uniref:Uncharacterized protein n=1 Tax=Eumeta variegata TaxID=151549 RepID=A0A4C2A834_EUMVA|nr:hypothetical protein EVAR_103776_1 [Eumeta japonica]
MLNMLIRSRVKSVYTDLASLQKLSQFGWGLFDSSTCKNILREDQYSSMSDSFNNPGMMSSRWTHSTTYRSNTRSKRNVNYNFQSQSNPQYLAVELAEECMKRQQNKNPPIQKENP